MKKVYKPMKPVKMWAVVDKNGDLLQVFPDKRRCKWGVMTYVEIREIPYTPTK